MYHLRLGYLTIVVFCFVFVTYVNYNTIDTIDRCYLTFVFSFFFKIWI